MTERRKVIYALSWSWRKSRIVKTKKRGQLVMKAWRRWHERNGWTVRTGNRWNDPTLIAYAPDYQPHHWGQPGPNGRVRVISLETYDAETKERIYPKPPPLNDPYSGIGFSKEKE